MVTPEPFPAPDPFVGTILKDLYRIDRRIGRGGMGAVYQATQLNLGRSVAVKFLAPLMGLGSESLQRFQREAMLLGQLNHPNIVGILDSGVETSGVSYMVMEFLKGQTLQQAVPSGKGLSIEALVDYFAQIAGAISAAHQLRLVHRDLKPENIIVAEVVGGGHVLKVLDFGIARGLDDTATRLTLTDAAVGTPGYLAPEQLHDSESLDERCDIYALGAVLYFMICGLAPYRGKTVGAILQMQIEGVTAPIAWDQVNGPRALEGVIKKAIQRNPDARYQSVNEMLLAFYGACGMEPPTALTRTPHATSRPSRAHPGRRRLLYACTATIGLSLVSGTAWLTTRGDSQARSPWSFRGVDNDSIRLGMSAAFTGPAKELGRNMRLGIETYFRYVNEELGGVEGRKLKLLALDDHYEPARAETNARQLLETDQVFALVGNVGTQTAAVTVPYAVNNKFLLFGALSGAGILRKDPPERYVFNYRASYEQETSAMVGYFLDVLKRPADSIMVFAQDDAYGDSAFEGVARTLRQRVGIDSKNIVRVGYDRNSTQVGEAVQKTLALREKVSAIVIAATYTPAAKYIADLRKAGMDALCAVVSFVGATPLAEEFINNHGAELADGVIVTQVVPHIQSNATGVLRFREHLARYSPSESNSFVALEGYVAAAVLVEGIRRAGWQLDTERLVDAMEQIHGFDPGFGVALQYGPSRHQGSDRVWATVMDRTATYRELKLD